MAGIIPDITTRVSVTVETDELDSAIDLVNSDDLLSELGLVDDLIEVKQKIENIKEPLGEAVAERLSSNQEMIISSKHYITGMMANSVDIMPDGEDYLVGNTAMSYDGFPYPLAIETGRREVYPINAKVLRWFDNGQSVFAHYSSPVSADPFVEPSIEDTLYDIDSIWEDMEL